MLPRDVEIPGKIVRDGEQWKCGICDFHNDKWRSVLGHLSKHKDGPQRKRGPKSLVKADPLDMTFAEIVLYIETLRGALAKEKAAHRNTKNILRRVVSEL